MNDDYNHMMIKPSQRHFITLGQKIPQTSKVLLVLW